MTGTVHRPMELAVLVTMYGTMGVTKTLRAPMATNQAIAALVPPFRCDPDYLAHALAFHRAGLERLAAQTTQPNLSGTIIRRFMLPVPPLGEQRRIAEILDTIDETIQATERVIAKHKGVRSGLASDLLEGTFRGAPLNNPKSNEVPSQHAPTGSSRESGVDEWTSARVGDVVRHIASGPSPTCEERNADGSEWGLLKTTAATWSGWNETAHKVPPVGYWGREALEVHSGDIIITKAGPRHRVGVVVHVPATRPRLMVSGKMVLLRPDESQVAPRLLADLLATPLAQKFLDDRTTGMAEAQTNFTNESLLDTPLLLPPLEEQQRIVGILDNIDETIQVNEGRLNKLRQLRSGLAADLLSGRVRTVAA